MTEATKASLEGLMKDVYGPQGLDSLVPDFSVLTKMIAFSEAKKTGKDFVIPVKLTNEHGFTYGAGIVTLQDIESAAVDDAKIRGASFTLRAGFSYDAAANMVSSRGSFITATKFKFQTMMEAATTRLEIQMLYGNVGFARSSGSGASKEDTNKVDLVISDARWSAGIFAASENGFVSLYIGDTANSEAGVGGVANKFRIVSVSNATKTIRLETANEAAADAIVIDVNAAAHDVHWFGAKGNEMIGLRTIVGNTGSLFGIDGATYSLWQGNSYGAGGALNLAGIYRAVNMAVSKGLMEEVCVLVSPATFAGLASDEASLRRYNTSTSKGERGVDGIEYHGPSGKIVVVVHPMVWEQEAYVFPKDLASRVGATDLTFNTPGRTEEMFKHLANETGYECRLYSEQAIFLPGPAKCVLITGIVNA